MVRKKNVTTKEMAVKAILEARGEKLSDWQNAIVDQEAFKLFRNEPDAKYIRDFIVGKAMDELIQNEIISSSTVKKNRSSNHSQNNQHQQQKETNE